MIPWKDLKLTDDYLFSRIMRDSVNFSSKC